MDIKSRESLYKKVQERMKLSYKGRKSLNYEYDKAVPKVYIIETIPGIGEKGFFENAKSEIKNVLRCSISFLDDMLVAEYNDNFFYFDPNFFYDIKNARYRFVSVFTFARSIDSDKVIHKMVSNSFFFDNQWIQYDDIPHENLTMIDSNFEGGFSGRKPISIKFDTRDKGTFERVLNTLKENRFLGFYNAYKFFFDSEDLELPLQAFYYSNGKLTLYGDGFEIARDIIRKTTDKYSRILTKIEEKSSSLDGVYIHFSNEPDQLELLKKIVNDADSKLIVFDIFSGNDYCRTMATDFHNGGIVELLMWKNVLRITIGSGSCANTVKRIVTILMKKFDPYLKVSFSLLEDSKGENNAENGNKI